MIIKLILFIQLFIYFSFANNNFIQSNNNIDNYNKLSKGLNYYLNNNNNNDDELKLWVFFNSKEKEINLNKININKESIKRRINRGVLKNNNNHIDEFDLPINENYINQILNCDNNNNNNNTNIKLNNKSNWLNSISITISSNNNKNQIIKCIKLKSFVKSIDLVLKYKNNKNNKNKEAGIINKEKEKEESNNENKFKLKKLNKLNDNNNFDESFYGQSFNGLKQTRINELQNLGSYDGSGIIILILDSGFNKNHQVFNHLKILDEYNFVDKINDTSNEYKVGTYESTSHGTATLSVLAGYLPGTLVGAAFNSTILLAKTEDIRSETPVEEDNWIAAIEWGESRGASLVTSSLGYSDWLNFWNMDGTTRLAKTCDIALNKGMVIVNSAGNENTDGISEPADGNYVISVGAINSSGSRASFSSLGPTADGRVKPDVMALGVSNYVADSTSDGKSFARASGTSFSCPLVASGIALLMQAHPTWTPKQIHQAVLGSASLSSSSSLPNINYGFGIFDALAAFNYTPINSVIDTCETVGCSNHGGCCNGHCTCAVTHYGEFCQYPKISCSTSLCDLRFGKCLIDKFNQSFTCANENDATQDIEESNYDPRDICSVCTNSTFSICGICGASDSLCKLITNPYDSYSSYSSSDSLINNNTNNTNKLTERNKLIIGLTVGIGGIIIILITITIIIFKNGKNIKNRNNFKLQQLN